MADKLPVVDVAARDFDSLVEIMTQRAILRFPNLPQTDFNFSNFTSMFIDLFAGVGDGLHFYQDNAAQDMFWSTVRDRENAIRLGALIGYRFRNATASKVSLRFTLDQAAAGNVIIPARTQVKTNDPNTPLIFETLEQAIIPAGQLFVNVDAENAELQTTQVISTGEANQSFEMDAIPYVQGSATVKVGSDVWQEVEDFFNSKTIDKDFISEVDADDRLTIEFGDGSNGAIPLGTIDITYKTGGGIAGNVFANTIKVLESTFTDVFSNSVNVAVTNPAQASGGTDRQTIGEARYEAPRSVKTNQRTVAREDFEINAQEVDGVSRAKVFSSDDNPTIPENTGYLYIVPVGGGVPTLTLRDAVYDYLTKTKPTTLGFVLNVVSPTYVPISFVMKVFVKDASFKTVVRQTLEATFNEYFSETITSGDEEGQPNEQMDFAKKFWNSEIISEAQESHPQIRNVELTTDIENLYALAAEEFPVKGVIVFEDGDTGLPLP